MSCAALYDEITPGERHGGEITMDCDCAQPCPATTRISAFRAAPAVFSGKPELCATGAYQPGKAYPHAGGPGAAAAPTRRRCCGACLRKLYRPEMMIKDLERMAIELGSDVPFCVRGVTTMVRGRGEQLLKAAKAAPCAGSSSASRISPCLRRRCMLSWIGQPQCAIDSLGVTKALEYQGYAGDQPKTRQLL